MAWKTERQRRSGKVGTYISKDFFVENIENLKHWFIVYEQYYFIDHRRASVDGVARLVPITYQAY